MFYRYLLAYKFIYNATKWVFVSKGMGVSYMTYYPSTRHSKGESESTEEVNFTAATLFDRIRLWDWGVIQRSMLMSIIINYLKILYVLLYYCTVLIEIMRAKGVLINYVMTFLIVSFIILFIFCVYRCWIYSSYLAVSIKQKLHLYLFDC